MAKTSAAQIPVERIDRKEEILNLSAQLFAEKGFHNTSMQDIAEAVAIQKASIYYYYPSKEAILWDVLDQGVTELLEDGRRALRESNDPREQLAALLRAHIRNLRRNLNHVIVFLLERRALDGRPEVERYVHWRREYDSMYVRVIRAGQAKGIFAEGDAQVMAYGIIGLYNWLIQWYNPNGALSIDEIHDILSGMALRALTRPDQA